MALNFLELAEIHARQMARAAIAAMREPTKAMRCAGQPGYKWAFPSTLTAESVAFRWQAMIDAALEEPEG